MLKAASSRFPMLQALQFRQFRLLWSGQSISVLGDNLFTVALAWQVLLITGSAAAMSIVVIGRLIPVLIFTLIGGAVADRLPKRFILLVSDSGRGLIVLLIALLGYLHLLQFWHLIMLSILFGIVDGFFSPAYASILPQLVDKEILQPANALTRLGNMVGGIIGPTLGALCVSTFGSSSAFLLDGISFVISAYCLLIMHIPTEVPMKDVEVQTKDEEKIQESKTNIFVDIIDGIKYVATITWLWYIILIVSVGNVAYGGPLAVSLPLLIRDNYHANVWLFGGFTAVHTIGALVATLIVGQIRHMKHRGIVAVGAVSISSVAMVVMGLPLSSAFAPIILLIAAFCGGLGLGFFGVIWVTLLQEHIPLDKLGRVSSIDMLGNLILFPGGVALIGILTDRIQPGWVFIAGGAINMLLVLIGLAIRDIRQLQ